MSIGSSKRETPNAAIVSRQAFSAEERQDPDKTKMETQICIRPRQDVQGTTTYLSWWWWWWWWRLRCLWGSDERWRPCRQPMSRRIEPVPARGMGITLKVSVYSTVLVPAYSLLKQGQLQLAQASFRDFAPTMSKWQVQRQQTTVIKCVGPLRYQIWYIETFHHIQDCPSLYRGFLKWRYP